MFVKHTLNVHEPSHLSVQRTVNFQSPNFEIWFLVVKIIIFHFLSGILGKFVAICSSQLEDLVGCGVSCFEKIDIKSCKYLFTALRQDYEERFIKSQILWEQILKLLITCVKQN